MKIFLALKQMEFAAKLFAAAGFNSFSAAFEAKNENALKEFLTQTATVEKVVEKLVEPSNEQLQTLLGAELREQITSAGFTLKAGEDPFAVLKAGLTQHAQLVSELANLKTTCASLTTDRAAFLSALNTAGVKLAADATPAALASALEARISMRAGEELAKHGVKAFPSSSPENNPAQPSANASVLTLADFQALTPAQKMAFSTAGGRISD